MFGVSVVDTYNVATQSLEYEDTSHEFFCDLTENTIDNGVDSRPYIPSSWITGRSTSPLPVRNFPVAHLFQTCQ